MKILFISASPHREKSSTFLLAQEVLRGAKEEGAECEVLHLDNYRVFFCKHCEACHRKILKCSLKDDVSMILEKMLNADGIILASPNYINQVTALMKALFDRSAHFIHCKRLLDKYVAGVVTSGSGQNKEVLDYIAFYGYTCGAQYSGGVSAIQQFGEDKKTEAFKLGKQLVSDIKEKKQYPEQMQIIEQAKQYFARIIKLRKDDWQEEYKYWTAKGWLVIFGLVFFLAKVLLVSAFAADFKTDSVVKIFATRNTIDYRNPWQSKGVQEITGSGCIIQGNRILTNAHVVNQNTFIQVRRESSQKKYIAKIETVGNDCDLATLRVQDPEFFKGVSPLEIGELPNLQDAVTVIGFPMGGDKLSITQGVVSRMEGMDYVNSNQRLLGVQIDAAINPGNSGGPAINDGKIVGIVMQLMSDSQNIGYIIPTPIINHFLKDSEGGQYAGFPYLGIHFSNTENKALRKYYGILDDLGGVLVYGILPFSSADGFLKEGDIILEVNGVAISDDSTFAFRNNERLDMVHLINMQKVGETAILKIRRQGKIIIVEVPLKPISPLVKIANHYEKPSFYIYGGLIFTVLSTDLNNALSSNESLPPLSFAYYNLGLGAMNEKRKKEIVVLLKVLPDEINIGYHDRGYEIVTKVNGQEFDSFEQFVRLIEDTQGENIVFEDEYKEKIILSCKDIAKVTQDIVMRNNIPSQFSDDVAEWRKK